MSDHVKDTQNQKRRTTIREPKWLGSWFWIDIFCVLLFLFIFNQKVYEHLGPLLAFQKFANIISVPSVEVSRNLLNGMLFKDHILF